MRGRDPRLRQPADQQQLTQMPGVSPVGLRTLATALQTARLNHLGQVHLGADPLELLDQEPPARRRLQRNLEPLAPEPSQELPDPGAIRRRDPRARDLARDRVDPLRRDLRTMLIDPHHQRHATTTPSTAQPSSTRRAAARRAAHRIPSTTVGTSYSIGRPRGHYPRAPPTPFDAEDRPPSPPSHANRHMTSFGDLRASGGHRLVGRDARVHANSMTNAERGRELVSCRFVRGRSRPMSTQLALMRCFGQFSEPAPTQHRSSRTHAPISPAIRADARPLLAALPACAPLPLG